MIGTDTARRESDTIRRGGTKGFIGVRRIGAIVIKNGEVRVKERIESVNKKSILTMVAGVFVGECNEDEWNTMQCNTM